MKGETMIKKTTLLVLVALAVYSFSYFGEKSDNPVRTNRATILYKAYDGEAPVYKGSTSNPQFWNAPMVFEGAKTVGDVEIGPEIPVTGLTGFYDYHFNGNQPHYMYRTSATNMYAAYMLALDSLSISPSRRVKIAFSSDDGDTWTDMGEVPLNFRAGFPSVNSKTTGEGIIASHYNDVSNTNLEAWVNYDLSPGIGVFNAVQTPEEFIWPIQGRLSNGNMMVYGTTYRSGAATDTTTLAIFNSTSNTFGARHDFFYPATANDNSSLALAGGTSGKAIVVINAYRETGGNFGGSRIFAFTSSDNGASWSTPLTIFNPQIIQGDTVTPFSNGATDAIYDNAGNYYVAFNSLGLTGFFSESRLYVQKNTGVPTLVAGGPTSPVNPIPEAMTTTAHQQAFLGSLDHPCLSISSDQQYIFVSYSVLFENDTLNGYNKAHMFYSYAPLSTMQWAAPVRVTDAGPSSNDERYGTIATTTPLVGGYYSLYMTYQKDTQPGSHAYNDGAPLSRSWLVFRKVTDATLIGVNNNQQIVKEYRLFQNYPNPFNPSTRIDYNLVKNSLVTLKVYDILGREVKTLVNGVQSSGAHNIQLNASELPSGIYFYTIRATDQGSGHTFTDTKKMILIK
jgi:Secretion system C-terminal sorting domain